jgi:hypothetical protein
VDDIPRKPLVVHDETERASELGLGKPAAAVLARLERRFEHRFIPAAPDRRATVRATWDRAVETRGAEVVEATCAAICQRRVDRRLALPNSIAFFAGTPTRPGPLDELLAGGTPEPAPLPAGSAAGPLDPRDEIRAQRWAPLLEAMTPAQLEAFGEEKRRQRDGVLALGLWTSEESRKLDQAEDWLFERWSRIVAGQPRVVGGVA